MVSAVAPQQEGSWSGQNPSRAFLWRVCMFSPCVHCFFLRAFCCFCSITLNYPAWKRGLVTVPKSQSNQIIKHHKPSVLRVRKHTCCDPDLLPGASVFQPRSTFSLPPLHGWREYALLQGTQRHLWNCQVQIFPLVYQSRVSTCSSNVHCRNHGIFHVRFGEDFVGPFLSSSGHAWFLVQRLQTQVRPLVNTQHCWTWLYVCIHTKRGPWDVYYFRLYLGLQSVTVSWWRAVRDERRIKGFFAQQPVGLMTPFTLPWTRNTHWSDTGPTHTQAAQQQQTLTVSHLHQDFSSLLQLEWSSLDENFCRALRDVNLQGCVTYTQVLLKLLQYCF